MKRLLFVRCAFLCLAAALLLSTGCALTTEKILIQPAPVANTAKMNGAENLAVKIVVSDVRAIKEKVSCKKNGYGMEMAAIVSTEDVPGIVAKVIGDELSSRGFKLADGGASVLIELNKFYSDFKIGFWSGSAAAEVVFSIQVKGADGNIKYAKSVIGGHTNAGVFLASGKNAKLALEEALADAITKLMSDNAFLDALVKSGS